MYSTAILKKDMNAVANQGVLYLAKWVSHKRITPENRIAAGRELFNILCLPCHSIGGPLNDIRKLSRKYTTFGMNAFLSGVGKLNNMYMPPFAGTDEEREALAHFIVTGLNGRLEKDRAPQLTEEPVLIPQFDTEKDEYVLLAWNSLGMHCITDSSRYFTLLPPANDVFAQLIRRGELPEVVIDGVTVTYRVEEGFENPAAHVDFWDNAERVFGRKVVENIGLSGNGLSGIMKPNASGAFVADLVPVVPYPDRGGYQPYPRFSIEARDSAGNLLAATYTVAPVATEMGCRNCHGGEWRVDGRAGLTGETARNILAAHDRNSGTALLAKAEVGEPLLCQSCHPDPILNAAGDPDRLTMAAALHGFHATYLANRGAEACAACHPSSPEGATRCLRGIHDEIGYDCTNCHGTLEDHALSLLKAEQLKGKERAGILMANLKPRTVPSVAEINPRTPWLNEPDCLNCHAGFQPPETSSAYNTWTSGADALYRNRRDESGVLYCAACHNSAHATYPAFNPYGENRDNIQPLQYQGNNLPIGSNRNCSVCHTVDMSDSVHHPNMEGVFRNQ
jgi:mono/diheme cytochrome c family protein